MKKFLRLSFVALMAMVANVAMAQNVLWEEDFGSYVAGDVPAGGAYSYKCTDGKSATKIYEEAIAQGTSPELLIGKKDASTDGGTFQATIDITNVNEEMTLTFKANKNLSVSVEGGTLGEKTNNGNDYSYPITKTADALTITFENTLTQNTRFDNVKLFTGQGKKAPGLSWGTSARTVTLGADDNLFPTLTNPFELPITYTSSEESVATIAADGSITLVKDGTTVIKAEFAGNDEYEAGAAQYTLTVKPAPAPTQDVTVAEALAVIEGLADGATTDQTYNVTGYAQGLDFQRNTEGALYGNVNFVMVDEQGMGVPELTVYRCKNIGNVAFTEETISDLKEGDKVVVYGQLQKYKSGETITPEIKNCYLVAINPTTGINNVTATKLNVNATMYNLAGQKVNNNYKGVVIQNGKKFIVK
jgi:hypothetical protein